MVFYSVYDDGFAAGFIDEIAYHPLYCTSPYLIQNSRSVFYCKYNLQVDLVICVRHAFDLYMGRAYGSPFILRFSFPRTKVRGYKISSWLRHWSTTVLRHGLNGYKIASWLRHWFTTVHFFLLYFRAVGSVLSCNTGIYSGADSNDTN